MIYSNILSVCSSFLLFILFSKTHTIHGTNDDPGMIPLAVEGIFDSIQSTTDRVFTLRVSYLEIYNEIINDLLEPLNTNLQLREDVKKGVYCERLKEDVVASPEQVFSLLGAGEAHRHVSKTRYNEQSSRSHTIFRMVLESQSRNAGKNSPVRTSILNLVDLAGSENAVKAGSVSRAKETGFINRSLLTLGVVISKLSERSLQHIPYRDSKLTRILQSSLSGKAWIAVVCNISPSSGNLEETISTLKFASRAKKMKSSATINETEDQSALLNQYRAEIDRLRVELEKYKSMPHTISTIPSSPSTSSTEPHTPASESSDIPLSKEELLKEEEEINQAALNAQIEQLTRMILTSESVAGEARELVSGEASPPASSPPSSDSTYKFNAKTSGATLRGKKAPSFKSPYATLNRSFSTSIHQPPTLNTITANVPSASSSSSSSTSSSVTSPPSVPSSSSDIDTSSTLSSLPNASPPAVSPSHSRRNSFSRLYSHSNDYSSYDTPALLHRIQELEEGNRLLHESVKQREKELKDWELYFVQVNNKNTALETRIKAITSSHTEKLDKVISRRTSQIQTGVGGVGGVGVGLLPSLQEKASTPSSAPVIEPSAAVIADENVMLEEGKKLMNELNELFDSYDSNSLIN